MTSPKGPLSFIDWSLFFPVIVLATLSLTTLFSLNVALFRSQLIFYAISFFIFLFFSHIHHRIIQLYWIPIYIASIILLVVVLGVGLETRGAVRWLDIFGLRIQFSEILKPFVAICFSSFLANRNRSFQAFAQASLLLSPVVVLIFIQPDLGTAMIYVLSALIALLVFGFPFRFFLGALVSCLALAPIGWNFLHDYQRDRVMTFIHPTGDPLGTSYNAIQSVIAVGSGMFSGKGLSEGTQSGLRFLPERHTDFIFATLSEELGFLGGVVIFVTFGYLLYRIYRIFLNGDDTFIRVFAAFTFSFILIQFFVNVGMNMGIVPIVGVTLPFVSYGGSSLLSNFIFLGFLSSMAHDERQKAVLEIR